MEELIIVDALTPKGVSIKRVKTAIIEGVAYELGLPFRKAYVNSENGRTALLAEVAEPFISAVLAVWGATPTVEDNPQPEI